MIIVCGMANSGTSIFVHLVRQHPDVVSVTNGETGWLYENDWLPTENARAVHNLERLYKPKRLLLKKPWLEVEHADFLVREFPDAHYVYCQRNFNQIIVSWRKPTSYVGNDLRTGNLSALRRKYDGFLAAADALEKKVKMYRVHHERLLADPKCLLDSLALWLGLRPFVYDVSAVGHGDVKKELRNSQQAQP